MATYTEVIEALKEPTRALRRAQQRRSSPGAGRGTTIPGNATGGGPGTAAEAPMRSAWSRSRQRSSTSSHPTLSRRCAGGVVSSPGHRARRSMVVSIPPRLTEPRGHDARGGRGLVDSQ
jgi:hypothetical protein